MSPIVNQAPLAREYLRVSRDSSGRLKSNDEQHDDHVRWSASLGVLLGESYGDAVSASKYGRKVRGDFNRLMADLEADRFDAQMLMIWESSRGSRKVSEWARLIEIGEQRGLKIAVYADDRVYDCTNARDVKALHDAASDAQYESSKTSMRTRRSAAAAAAEGRPHGRVPYGYMRTYVDKSSRREMESQVPHPVEGPIVCELFRRFLAGEPLNVIARDFDVRGIRTRSGKVFRREHLRGLLKTPVYAALRIYQGQVVEGIDAWEPLVSRADWRRVQSMLAAPERRKYRPGRARWLCSGVLRCGVCGGPTGVKSRKGERLYGCNPHGHVSATRVDVDDLVEETVQAYLEREEIAAYLTRPVDDGRLAAAEAELAEAEADLHDLADQVAKGTKNGGLSATLAARAEPEILRRIDEARRRVKDLERPSVLRDLLAPGDDVRSRWAAAPVAVRREALRLLCVPELLGAPHLAKPERPPRTTRAELARRHRQRRKRHDAGDHSTCVRPWCEDAPTSPLSVAARIEWHRPVGLGAGTPE